LIAPRRLRRMVASALFASRASHVLNACLSSRLTVLTYHRIANSIEPSFEGYGPTVSATADAFARQIAFLDAHCHVVSLSAVVDAIRGVRELPARAVLITFDDGYRDNIDIALPQLAARGLPAAVFLATDQVGGGVPFFWEAAAHLFARASVTDARLPLVGERRWSDRSSKNIVLREFVERLAPMPEPERQVALATLAAALDVTIPSGALAHLHMTWDDARRGARAGLEFGSHTMGHAWLPHLSAADVRAELIGSKSRLERELGVPVVALAYPNGAHSPDVRRAVQTAGYVAAFSCRPGPSSFREVRTAPFDIRRVGVSSSDTLPMFATKLVGFARMQRRAVNAPTRLARATGGHQFIAAKE
jgi:peptidoglycan/xylan/chitin deacetylase (PgdA/CDA1 family)